jgi:hypothetical protein
MDQATFAPSTASPSPNRFAGLADIDEDSAPVDEDDDGLGLPAGTPPNDTTARKDGGSQPLIDKDNDALPVPTSPIGVTTIVTALAEHNRIMALAIAAVVAPPQPDRAVPPSPVMMLDTLTTTMLDTSTTNPTLADMMLFLQRSHKMMQHNHRTVIAHLSPIDGLIDTVDNETRLLCTAIGAKVDSTKIARLDSRMEDMAATIALTVHDKLNATLGSKLTKASDSIVDVKANLQHMSKKLTATDASTTTRLDDMLASTSKCIDDLAAR